jgi:hypothetical protein
MKTKQKLIRVLICTTLLSGITSVNAYAQNAEIAPKVSFSENGKPRALDLYWHRMAQCETGGDWKNTGQWSGGLGIYTQTWKGYGGLEFASKPYKATIDEQIIVANRISTQGYQTKNEFRTLQDKLNNKPFFRPPVGFSGWGCKKHVGKPVLFKKFPAKTLFHEYRLGERSSYVFNLQKIIGVKYVDGLYGPHTDSVYNKFMAKYRKYIIAEYNKYKQ